MKGAPPWLLRESPAESGPGTRAAKRPQPTPHQPRVLVCLRCAQPITSPAAACSVAGAHQHTRANPHGFVFRIGCFREAPGCLATGAATHEYSWFPAYAWRVAVCSACVEHLGWLFRCDDDAFYGLILDRLVEREAEG